MNIEDNNNILIVSEKEIVSKMESKKKVDDRDDFLRELNKSTYLPRLRMDDLHVDR